MTSESSCQPNVSIFLCSWSLHLTDDPEWIYLLTVRIFSITHPSSAAICAGGPCKHPSESLSLCILSPISNKKRELGIPLDELDDTENVFHGISQAFKLIREEHNPVYSVRKISTRLGPILETSLRLWYPAPGRPCELISSIECIAKDSKKRKLSMSIRQAPQTKWYPVCTYKSFHASFSYQSHRKSFWHLPALYNEKRHVCATYVTGSVHIVRRANGFAVLSWQHSKTYWGYWEATEYMNALRPVYEAHGGQCTQ